ncbi:MAG: hypothetical protein B7X67_17045 [Rhizobiales bacterium 39-66-18]|nr:MAG: hypothetical protein B7X67_17045 [Rhizobiales bacterium 39-66-18]
MLILSGAMDPIVPADNAATLARMLSANGAAVEHVTVPAGHGLSQSDLAKARAWISAVQGDR